MSKLLALALLGAIAVAASADQFSLTGRSLLNNDDPTQFPYCKCTYRLRRSPYRLVYDKYLVGYKGNDWACFNITLDTSNTVCEAVPVREPCCSADLYKIEFDVDPACKGTTTRVLLFKGIDRSVNGVTVQEQINTIGIDDIPEIPGAAILRITRGLTMPQSVVRAFMPSGLPICVNKLPSSCTLNELFKSNIGSAQYSIFDSTMSCCPTGTTGPTDRPVGPAPIRLMPPSPSPIRQSPPPSPVRQPPPPPPPRQPPPPPPVVRLPPLNPSFRLSPPPGFQFTCQSYSSNSFPWRASVVNVTAARVNNLDVDKVCIRMFVDPAAAATCNNNLCGGCTAGLEKFELLANGACKGSISPFTLSTTTEIKSSFNWDSIRPILRFTRLDLTYAQGVAGASLCFTFKGPSCTRWSELCPPSARGCPIAFFNPPGDSCCPRSTIK